MANDTLMTPSKNMLFESDETRILAISFQRLPFLTSPRRKSIDYFYWNRSVFFQSANLSKQLLQLFTVCVGVGVYIYMHMCVPWDTSGCHSTTCGILYPPSAL